MRMTTGTYGVHAGGGLTTLTDGSNADALHNHEHMVISPTSKALPPDHTFLGGYLDPIETDPGELLSGFSLLMGVDADNTTDRTLYVRFNDTGTHWEVLFYSDAARTALVAHTGTFVSPNIFTVYEDNASGIGGKIIVDATPRAPDGGAADDSVSATWPAFPYFYPSAANDGYRIDQDATYALFGRYAMKVTGKASTTTPIALAMPVTSTDLTGHSFRFAYYVEDDCGLETSGGGGGGMKIYFYDGTGQHALLTGLPVIQGRHHIVDFTTTQTDLANPDNNAFDWSTVSEIRLYGTGSTTISAWANNVTYYPGNHVTTGGTHYRCIATNNTAAAAGSAIQPGVTDGWDDYWEVSTSTVPIVHFSLLEARPNTTTPGTGYIIVHEDDAVANSFDTLMRMARIGVKVGIAVPGDLIGSDGYMTWDQLAALVRTGNVRLYSHKYETLPTYTDTAAQRAYMRAVQTDIADAANAQGEPFGNPGVYIIPAGTAGSNSVPRHPDDYPLMWEYMPHIRGTSPFYSGVKLVSSGGGGLGSDIKTAGSMPPDPVNPRWSWAMVCKTAQVGDAAGADNENSWISPKGVIPRCIADGTVAVPYFHGVGSADPEDPTYHALNNLTQEAADTLCDYLETQIKAGNLVPIWTEDLYR
jgi:hypothetical protein